ncbi:protein SNORC [Python bivittatus]|uniref:Protein SNORC n=1 Tax=Python bivittatus TaxID=176946 RepID=A0A9F5IMA6_PYTBI|nr:protein SNORC [Python bivittatus]
MLYVGVPDKDTIGRSEYSQGPIPTLWNDPPELPSGGGPLETTPPARFSDSTGFPPYTSDYELEDTTHLHQLDNGNVTAVLFSLYAIPKYSSVLLRLSSTAGSLGPGAIGAIVIAALLGASVIVALIVITLRKCSAS